MSRRINYPALVGEIRENKREQEYKIIRYEGKAPSGKRYFQVEFLKTNNREMCHWGQIRAGTVYDTKADKLEKKLLKEAKLKVRRRTTKQVKTSYNLSGITTSRVLAVDLASHTTGIAYADRGKILKAAIIQAEGKDFRERCHKMIKKILQIIIKLQVEKVIIEDVYLSLNSTILAKLAELRGMLTYHLEEREVDLILIPAAKWKNHYSMPRGREKQKAAAISFYKQFTGKIPATDDEADAYLLLKACLEISNSKV